MCAKLIFFEIKYFSNQVSFALVAPCEIVIAVDCLDYRMPCFPEMLRVMGIVRLAAPHKAA